MKTKRWIGRWIMGVGVVHTMFGLFFMRDTWSELIDAGLFNTVNGQPEREFAFWFLFAGLVTILFGRMVDELEKRGEAPPRFVAWFLAVLVVFALIVMPISGGWLLVPAVVGLLLGKSTDGAA